MLLRLAAALPAARAWADADLPIYSTGFLGGTTLFAAFPLIVVGEGLILWWLMRRSEEKPYCGPFEMSLKANLASAGLGLIVSMPIMAVFDSIWRRFSDTTNAEIVLRQLFGASYLATIAVEAFMYQALSEKGRVWPRPRYWSWSLATNSASYGLMAWLWVLGWLDPEQTTSALFWRMLRLSLSPRR